MEKKKKRSAQHGWRGGDETFGCVCVRGITWVLYISSSAYYIELLSSVCMYVCIYTRHMFTSICRHHRI